VENQGEHNKPRKKPIPTTEEEWSQAIEAERHKLRRNIKEHSIPTTEKEWNQAIQEKRSELRRNVEEYKRTQ